MAPDQILKFCGVELQNGGVFSGGAKKIIITWGIFLIVHISSYYFAGLRSTNMKITLLCVPQ